MFECRAGYGETTLVDCKKCPDFSAKDDREELLLVNKLCPGDVLVMTAAIESLHKAHPGRFLTAVRTSCDAIFDNNPHVAPAAKGMREIVMEYPLIHQSNELPVHFMEGYCRFLADTLKIPVPLSVNRPHLYLSKEEKGWINQVQEITGKKTPFWIINGGKKGDYPAKHWGFHRFQKLVNILKDKITFVQIGAANHDHQPIENVINLVGKTNHRQLIRLVYHCQGGVGPSTYLQHLCAAWEKPYICLLGGREPVSWVQYKKQVTFHTIGQLNCCRNSACWVSRVIPLGDGDDKDKSICHLPEIEPEPVAGCMAKISPEQVAESLLRFV